MKAALAPLFALALLLPLASARPWPDVDEGDHTVGPCHAAWTFYVDADTRLVECHVAGTEVLYYSEGTTLLGHHCTLRVAGQTLRECSPGS